MYLHCIRLLRIFDRFADFGVFFLTYRSCLHLLHVMEWFSYVHVFALYTFVTLFERCT